MSQNMKYFFASELVENMIFVFRKIINIVSYHRERVW